MTRISRNCHGAECIHPVAGNLTALHLRLPLHDGLAGVKHVLHIGAIYDMTTDAESQQRFTKTDFDKSQVLLSPYHCAKLLAALASGGP